ncbi:unnamed protein product [Rotaria sp. Silwood1]|nr:unnamed protein product [Rotaria sp. Silwood1]
MASSIMCPPPSDGICSNATWNRKGLTRAGGHGQGSALNQLGGVIQGLFVDDDLTVYVSDSYNNRVVKWMIGDLSGRIVAGGNENGDANNQLAYVESIVIAKNGTMFICDRWNQRVQRLLKDESQGETIISDILCGGMALDNEGSLYIVTDREERVLKWPGNQTVAGGNGQGSALNQLSNPLDLFVDSDHSVYVVDFSNNRIVKWPVDAKEGIIVAGGNQAGNSTSQLDQPSSVVVDKMGTIYVLEIGNSRIVRWFKNAKVGIIIVGGNGPGDASDQLSWPKSLTIDRHGNLYVADSDNHRVQMFTIDKSSCSTGMLRYFNLISISI